MNEMQTKDILAFTDKAINYMDMAIREDQYDGEHSLYRMAATIYLNKNVPNFVESLELKYIVNYLSNLPVRPHRVFVDDDRNISVDWFANGALVVSNKAQYVQLIMEFQMFLLEHSSPFFTLELQNGFYNDDPNERITGYPIEELNLNPKFDAKCFGSNKKIKVIKF